MGSLEMEHGESHMSRRVGWQIDRKIPVALIIAILTQTGAGIWWIATANQRLASLEERMTRTAPNGDRLTRVEVKVESALDGISEIKAILRKEPIPAKSNR
jgi:hypothetical protein